MLSLSLSLARFATDQPDSLHPSAFDNESARSAFTQAVRTARSYLPSATRRRDARANVVAAVASLTPPAQKPPHPQPQVQLGETATVMTERFFDSLMGEINNSKRK